MLCLTVSSGGSEVSSFQKEIDALADGNPIKPSGAMEHNLALAWFNIGLSQAQAEIAELKADNKKYKSQLIIEKLAEVENLIDVNNQLKEELRLERECVDFYADHDSYDDEFIDDGGKRARQRQATRKILTDKDR